MINKRNSEWMSHVLNRLKGVVLISGLALYLIALPRAGWTEYVYNELLAPGMLGAHSHAINNSGTVVGDGIYSDVWNGFIYSSGSYADMILSGWTETYAFGINNYDEVAGFGNDGAADKAFIYRNGVYTALMPPGWIWAEAYGINDNGEVVGFGSDGTTNMGFIYSGGVYTELIPPGWISAEAHGINDDGDVVGFGNDGTDDRGFLYSGGVYTELLPPEWTESYAYDINNNGDIVGLGEDKGFLYKGGTFSELIPPGWDYLFAWGVGLKITNNGMVIGSGRADGMWKGFVYQNGDYSELFPANWGYAFAHDINENGIVTGWGSDSSWTSKGFVVDACANLSVLNDDTVVEYDLLQNAYDEAADGTVIRTRHITLTEDPLLDLNKAVILIGGCDCGYTVNDGITTIQGDMIIISGRLTIAGGTVMLL